MQIFMQVLQLERAPLLLHAYEQTKRFSMHVEKAVWNKYIKTSYVYTVICVPNNPIANPTSHIHI